VIWFWIVVRGGHLCNKSLVLYAGKTLQESQEKFAVQVRGCSQINLVFHFYTY
jgi:hypothetical protein